jgi:hypothetical protein
MERGSIGWPRIGLRIVCIGKLVFFANVARVVMPPDKLIIPYLDPGR